MKRREPILLTRKVLLRIYRAKRNGCTALGISEMLNAPYSQILDVLHPQMRLGNKLPAAANRRPRWSYSAHPSELAQPIAAS